MLASQDATQAYQASHLHRRQPMVHLSFAVDTEAIAQRFQGTFLDRPIRTVVCFVLLAAALTICTGVQAALPPLPFSGGVRVPLMSALALAAGFSFGVANGVMVGFLGGVALASLSLSPLWVPPAALCLGAFAAGALKPVFQQELVIPRLVVSTGAALIAEIVLYAGLSFDGAVRCPPGAAIPHLAGAALVTGLLTVPVLSFVFKHAPSFVSQPRGKDDRAENEVA